MSKYTTELRYICESLSGLDESKGYSDIDTIIANSRGSIFSFDYPIFDENYRSVLETKILRHYYMREIGAETYGLWKHWLQTKMNEIMPYYNKMYESTLLQFNPLFDTDISITKEESGNGTKENAGSSSLRGTTTNDFTEYRDLSEKAKGQENSISNSKENLWNKYSDTPQGGINGLANDTYLTNATHNTSDGVGTTVDNKENEKETTDDVRHNGEKSINNSETTSNMSEFSDTREYTEHILGKRYTDTYGKLIKDFRESFINVDVMVINELSDLFMNLW